MSDSIREQIIAAIVARMAIIRTANGFLTDCGENVHRGAKRIDPSKLDAISVFARRETASAEYSVSKQIMPVDVQAISAVVAVAEETEKERAERVSKIIEKMLADIIEAMTEDRWTLAFTSGSRAPVAGETITGAISGATGYVESAAVTGGSWTGGNAAGTVKIRRKSGTFQAENINIGALLDCFSIDGGITRETAIALATSSKADGIYYTEGGPQEYPEVGDAVVAVSAVFNITYPTQAGNPFAQP